MPTTAQNILAFSGTKLEPYQYPEDVRTMAVKIASTTGVQAFLAGTVMGQLTSGLNWTDYDNSASDGSEVAVAILVNDITVDTTANGGKITLTNVATQVGGPNGETYTTAEVYVAGCFRTDDLKDGSGAALTSTPLSAGLTDLKAHTICTTATGAIFRF